MPPNFNEELNKIKITQNIGALPALWQHQPKYQKSSVKKWVISDVEHEHDRN